MLNSCWIISVDENGFKREALQTPTGNVITRTLSRPGRLFKYPGVDLGQCGQSKTMIQLSSAKVPPCYGLLLRNLTKQHELTGAEADRNVSWSPNQQLSPNEGRLNCDGGPLTFEHHTHPCHLDNVILRPPSTYNLLSAAPSVYNM